MRAARLKAPRVVELCEVPAPRPGPDQVRIRIEGCGICGSNLAPWHGLPWLSYPLAPGEGGHEAWGVVDAVGEAVRDVLPGERVAALCQRAFAEYDVARADELVKLPHLLDGVAFPGEPFACAFNVFRRSRIGPGDTVAVVGAGFIGAVVVRLAAAVGARVIALARRPFSLELARRLGAAETVPLAGHGEAIERVRELTDQALCDVVVEAAGAQWPLDLAGELTRERGTLVIAGYHQDGPRQVNMQQWNWRGLDVVNAHERDPAEYVRGMRAAVWAATAGALDPRDFVTHELPLEELGRALELAGERPAGLVKAVVRP